MIAAPPTPPRLEPDPGAAVIEEARRHRRTRRRRVAAASLLALMLGVALFVVIDRSDGSNRPGAAAGAPIAAGCPSAPATHVGSLGAVAYIRSGRLRVVDIASGTDRVLARVSPGPVNWSPDGRWLTAGSTIVAAATGAACSPFGRSASLTWFPDRDALIVGTKRGRYLLAAAGTKPRPVLPRRFQPAGAAPISPDGTSIAATGPRVSAAREPESLWISDVATGRQYLVWTPRNWDIGPATAARWSRDGRWVLFEPDEQGSGSIAADGLPLLAVAVGEGPLARIEPRVLTPPDFVQSCGPRALVASAGPDRYVSAHKRLDLIAPPAWRARNISRDSSRSWYAATCSPDGRVVAATTTPNREEGRMDSAERSIRLVSLGGSARALVGRAGDGLSDEQPRWSRDGRWILYVEHPARFGASARLYLVDVATGARRGPFGDIGAGDGFYGYHDWNELAAWYQPR
jgi:WD40 repeat protein